MPVLAEWLFEIDFTSGNQIGDALMEIHGDYPKALKKLGKAKEFVVKRQKDSIDKIKQIKKILYKLKFIVKKTTLFRKVTL